MTDARLHDFVARHRNTVLPAKLAAIREALSEEHASEIEPLNHGGWTASHLTEIDLFGVFASGATAEEAAETWFKCAGRMVEDCLTPTFSSRRADAQSAEALFQAAPA